MIDGLDDTGKRVGIVVAAQEAPGFDFGAPAADRDQGVVEGVDGVEVDRVERSRRLAGRSLTRGPSADVDSALLAPQHARRCAV